MDCRTARDRAADDLDAGRPFPDAVAAHLAACRDCAAWAAEQACVDGLLTAGADALRQRSADPGLPGRLAAGLRRPPASTLRWRQPVLAVLLAAAAVLVAWFAVADPAVKPVDVPPDLAAGRQALTEALPTVSIPNLLDEADPLAGELLALADDALRAGDFLVRCLPLRPTAADQPR